MSFIQSESFSLYEFQARVGLVMYFMTEDQLLNWVSFAKMLQHIEDDIYMRVSYLKNFWIL